MRIALGQINPTVADLSGNLALMLGFAKEAAARNAELIVFPELPITGYPPRDLVEKPGFIGRSERAVEQLADMARDLPISIVAGYVGRSHKPTGNQATNSAAVIRAGNVVMRQTKILLPTDDVFDEARNFVAADTQSLSRTEGEHNGAIALAICDDALDDEQVLPHLPSGRDPVDVIMLH